MPIFKKSALSFIHFSSFIIVFLISSNTLAKEGFGSLSSEFIIQSCREVAEIYKARDEKRFMASQRTSLAEAMRAGYCLGLLAMTKCNSRDINQNDWMTAAHRIGVLSLDLQSNKDARPLDILGHGACDQ